MSSSGIRIERVKKLDLQKLYSFYFFLTFHLNQRQKCIQNPVKHLIRKNLHLRGFKGLWIFLLKCNLFSYWFKFNRSKNIHAFFISDIFSTQPQCYLTLSWNELQMLLGYYLIHVTIIILRRILYLVYLGPFLGLGLRPRSRNEPKHTYLCCIFVICFSFSAINSITSLKRRTCFLHIFYNISYYFWMIAWMTKANNFQSQGESSASNFCPDLSLELIVKVVLIYKKSCNSKDISWIAEDLTDEMSF